MKTICFVHCVNEKLARTQMFGIHYMPVWIYTLVPYLRDIPELEFEIYDNRILNSKIPAADYYFFSGINQDEKDIMSLHSKIKRLHPAAQTIIGGPIAWSFDVGGSLSKLSCFDYILIGEGENIINKFVQNLINKKLTKKIFKNEEKFSLAAARHMDTQLLDATLDNYYGGIVEVSRGCPFLCEFCDIRIQIDNNRSHSKNVELIISEIEYFADKGISQILFACDNFIGDPIWAELVCDKIIEWQDKSNKSIKIYTWLTINLANHKRLLGKMKLAGFDMLFVGIESFGTNQLLETAKVQNVNIALTDSVKVIQSYGFIIVAGLIFGFDSDPADVVEQTLNGLEESGLITGDPSLLVALPGTPLFKRLAYSERLRTGKVSLGGSKFATNIKYLKPKDQIIAELQDFVHRFNKGKYQYARYRNYVNNLGNESEDEKSSSGYINITKFLLLLLKNPSSILPFFERFIRLGLSPERTFYIFKGLLFSIYKFRTKKSVFTFYKFWIFMWSNSVLKYSNIVPSDFDIDSVSSSFDLNNLVPQDYIDDMSEPIPSTKIRAQRKLTRKALESLNKKELNKVNVE